tara:strand:+ start:140 stop:304 length:165 start_codon:yes stop_codon:yes gene_type:complete
VELELLQILQTHQLKELVVEVLLEMFMEAHLQRQVVLVVVELELLELDVQRPEL